MLWRRLFPSLRTILAAALVMSIAACAETASVGGPGDPDDPDDPGNPPGQGTLHIEVDGLDASASTGGTATVAPTGNTGGTEVTVGIAQDGSADVSLPAGTYQLTYDPPAVHGVASGDTREKDVTVTSGETSSVTFQVVFQPGQGDGGLEGSVAADNGAVGGGVVEVWSGNSLVATAAIGGNGTFSVSVPAGSYQLRLQPASGYAIGANEADPRNVAVQGGAVTDADFEVQPAVWFDNFTRYASSASLRSDFANDPGGSQGQASGVASACVDDRIFLDGAAGPGGAPSMRYDYWNRVEDPSGEQSNNGVACGQPDAEESMSIFYARNFTTPRPTNTNMWVRFVSKEGTTPQEDPSGPNYFSISCAPSCSELAGNYKFFRSFFDSDDGIFSIHMGSSGADADPLTGHTLQWTRWPVPITLDMGDAPDWQGRYHTYTYGFRAEGGDWGNVTLEIYIDGVLQDRQTGVSMDPIGGLESLLLGANMNSGPGQEQSRWFAEVGLYYGRPSVRPAQ